MPDIETDDTIRFYRANQPYGAFSNLFPRTVNFNDWLYLTAEHAYQAQKTPKPEIRDWLLAAPKPYLLAIAAHGLPSWDVVPDWTTTKVPLMRAIVEAKFRQHPDLAELLLSTGDKRIAESGTTPNAVNKFWGEIRVKEKWVGQNTLGVILMDVRGVLRAEREGNRDV